MAGFADSTREGGFAGAAGATTSSSGSSSGGLTGSTRDGGFASAGGSNIGGGGGGGGGGSLANSTRDGGFASAKSPSSGGITGLKSSTGFFSGATKSADYDTIQKSIVASRSPLDAFGLRTLSDFGVKAYSFKNDLEDYQSLLAKTPNPTSAQQAQFKTLGKQLTDRATALQEEAASVSGLPMNQAGFSAFAKAVNDPFGITGGMYNPETYGLTVNKAGVGTAPGYNVAGPYTLGNYEGVYLGMTDKVPTMTTKGIADLVPEKAAISEPVSGFSELAPLNTSPTLRGVSAIPTNDFRAPSTALPANMTPYPTLRYTYSGPKTGLYEQFGGTMAPGLSTAAMAAGYRAATGTVPASEYARQYFQSRGLSPTQSAALVARFEHESSLNPDKWSAVPGESSYGLAQWNKSAGRLPELERYAASYNAPASDFDTQLNFVVREMNTTEQKARDALMRANTPTAALNAVTAYERPRGYTPSNPSLASGYQDTLNRFNAIMAGTPARNYDVLSGEEFRGPGSNYAAPMPVAGQKQIVDQIVPEKEVVREEVVATPASGPVDLTGLNANPPLEATRFLREPQNIVPAQYGNMVGRDPYEGVPAQSAEAVVQRKTGAPAIPNYSQNFFGQLVERFTGANAGNNYTPFPGSGLPVNEYAGRGDNRRPKKPVLPVEEVASAAAQPAPANTGLVWDFQTTPVATAQPAPDVYAQYRSLFAQPARISTGVGSLLPSMEVVPSRG